MSPFTYGDIYIAPLDREYIDSLPGDYWDAPIYPEHGPIVNQIIDYIAREMIEKMDISDESKDKLRDAICPNSIATTIDAEPEDFPPEEQEAVKQFINSF